MAHKDNSTTLLRFSRFVSVLYILFAFVLFSFPQLSVGMTSITHGAESPIEKDENRSEEKLTETSLARGRAFNPRMHVIRSLKFGKQSMQVCLCFDRQPVIVGHQLSNGLRAPLLI